MEVQDDIKFNSGLELYVSGMKLCKNLLKDAMSDNDKNKSFIHFYHFLCDMFALRENLKIIDSENMYVALKNYYECIKHFNNHDKVQNINLFIYSKKYPYSYPYTYGPAILRFKEMDKEVAKINNRQQDVKANKMIEVHNKFLKDKNVIEVLEICITECEELLKENDNG
ncbi:MAG: hypothetical protein IJA72_01510 [Clostridia bacterium]|nr:hypothetical protein [Clostridia bacterium]